MNVTQKRQFGKRLAAARRQRLWSQADLMEKFRPILARLGAHEHFTLNTATISRWETGLVEPSRLGRRVLTEVFGPLEETFGIPASDWRNS